MVFSGLGHVRWLRRGNEVRYDATPGSLHFVPADGEVHTFLANAPREASAYTLFLPQRHLDALAAEDHSPSRCEYHRLFIASDAILQACMVRLAHPPTHPDETPGHALDSAARRLVLRLVELSGGGVPEWRDDASVFNRRTLACLVDYIEAHLNIEPSLSDMALMVGLSPSHCAKKFRQSTGLSLHRFVNRRRILTSMESLKKIGRAHV